VDSGLNRVSTLSWFVKTVRSGARFPDGTLPAEQWKRGGVSPTLNAFDNGGDSRATVLTVLGEVTHTLTSEGSDGSEDGTGRGTPIVAFSHSAGIDLQVSEDATPSVLAGHDRMPSVQSGPQVRRLTPVECERLQGLPDDWTAWGLTESGERVAISDSARYRMVGNGVAVPVVEWVAAGVVAVESADGEDLPDSGAGQPGDRGDLGLRDLQRVE
jgi:site-specific DNA-cytosine methylase